MQGGGNRMGEHQRVQICFRAESGTGFLLATSQEVRDRGSTFVASAFRAVTPAEAAAAVKHLKFVLHASKPATHEISAWRCMVLKNGCTGLGGLDDFEMKSGSQDDGESWAGGKVLKVMQSEGVIDVVIVVSRWYGGTMLGPARFAHIETCTREACRVFKRKDEMDDCIATLSTLDDILSQLREELAAFKPASDAQGSSSSTLPSSRKSKQPDYSALIETMDVNKAKRFITAREKAIDNTKKLIFRAKTVTD
ncbi:hypothetical protein HGRIS_001971 [Hohenbuehelia grisea]|uniref:Impact N-terminal domain-containing protein n=1 Tax=Hohenbuehelia grisea TaxID=104357 RepID=A0ABR3JJ56_9AGAR